MKRLLVGMATGVLLVALMPSVVSASFPNDAATGSGRVEGLYGAVADFSLSARSGPAGEDAKGNLNFRNVDYPDGQNGTVAVTCLLVVGNEAIIGGPWKKSSSFPDPDVDFDFGILYVQDNGQPNGPVADVGVAYGTTGPLDCGALLDFSRIFAQPLLHGNVVVRDAD